MKKTTNLVVGIVLLIFFIGCNKKIEHRGKINFTSSIKIDSIVIDASNTSGRGNFYINDTIITFADRYYLTFYDFNANTGKLISKHFGKGHGPNELSSFLFAYPDSKHNRTFILDESNFLYSFDSTLELIKHNVIDFGWEDNMNNSSDFNNPKNYNVMELVSFGVDYTYINDSILMIPVNVIHRKTSKNGFVNSKEYDEGHIFGLLNLNSMKVEKVFGKYPFIYKNKSVPHLENFRYSMNKDIIYVNHAIDSLIYVYKYPDKLLYTFGYECNNVNRDYTITRKTNADNAFYKDIKECSLNSGLNYIPQVNYLIRTYMINIDSGESGLQIYKGNDLIGDFKMPAFFIFLGYYDNFYYGVRFKPIETMNTTKFIFYKFAIR